MTFVLRLDVSNSSDDVPYTNDLIYELSLPQREEKTLKREWTTTTTSEYEENINYSIAKRKKGTSTLQGLNYFSKGEDKSQGTLQRAIYLEEIDALEDASIKTQPIEATDTTNNTVTVSGDIRRRVDTSSDVALFGAGLVNEIHGITSVSYDEVNDQTTIGLDGNTNILEADGNISTGVFTVEEQQNWLEDYIWANIGAPQHLIEGGRYNDSISEFGTKIVIDNIPTSNNAGQTVGEYTIVGRFGRPV